MPDAFEELPDPAEVLKLLCNWYLLSIMTDLHLIRAVALRHVGYRHPLLPRLIIARFDAPTVVEPLIYDPVVTLVLQGTKRILVGDDVFEFRAGDCMVVAAEIAAMGQISEASSDQPFLAVGLVLDQILLSDLLVDLAAGPEPTTEPGYRISTASLPLLDAWRRLLELLDRQSEIPMMAHHLEREVTFRLLMSPHGGLLRQIAGADSRLSQIRHAMAWIRERYAEHVSVEAMAATAGMSPSVFHRHFKAVTALTPLQYQKQVRLHEARRSLMAGASNTAEVGFAVGYKSTSQFSREYKRLFGAPPARDTSSPTRGRGTTPTERAHTKEECPPDPKERKEVAFSRPGD